MAANGWGKDARKKGLKVSGEPPGLAGPESDEFRALNVLPDTVRTPEQTARLNELYEDIRRKEQGVPSAPYIASSEGKPSTTGWVDLALKRALKEAAVGGYDRLAWTPGAEQADRYSLAKQVSKVVWSPENERLVAFDHNGGHAIDKWDVKPTDLPDLIGKEAAEKLLSNAPKPYVGPTGVNSHVKYHHLEGGDLKVGGEGMKSFYDKIVPTQLTKMTKKLDPSAKVEPYSIGIPEKPINDMSDSELMYNLRDDAPAPYRHTLHSIPITPAMRANILKGLPAYAKGGRIIEDALRLATSNT